jgi:hypothetical protein
VLKTRDRLVDGLLAAIGGDEHGNGDWKGNIILFLGLAVGFIVRSLLCLGCVSRWRPRFRAAAGARDGTQMTVGGEFGTEAYSNNT